MAKMVATESAQQVIDRAQVQMFGGPGCGERAPGGKALPRGRAAHLRRRDRECGS
jgi:hypothetical protein